MGGRVRISPYGGYHLILAQGSASAVGVLDGAGQLHAVLLPDRIRAAHRGFAGVRLRAGLFTLGLHVDAGPRVQRFGLQVGLRY